MSGAYLEQTSRDINESRINHDAKLTLQLLRDLDAKAHSISPKHIKESDIIAVLGTTRKSFCNKTPISTLCTRILDRWRRMVGSPKITPRANRVRRASQSQIAQSPIQTIEPALPASPAPEFQPPEYSAPDVFVDSFGNPLIAILPCYEPPEELSSPNENLPFGVSNTGLSGAIDGDDDDEDFSHQRNRWKFIQDTFSQNMYFSSVDHFERIVKDRINPAYNEFNFDSLRDACQSLQNSLGHNLTLTEVLPGIVKLALSIKNNITQPIPLLRQNEDGTLFMSQQQIACLLANAFLCLYPMRNSSLFRNYPDINFWRLLSNSSPNKVEKLKCILNYFRRVIADPPLGVVSFTRRSLKPEQMVDWSQTHKSICRVAINVDGRIENEGRGMLQVDFANQMIGGGVLSAGCVQEEILFCVFPEMIASRLFCERMLDNEAIFIQGSEQYNSYVGYAGSFKWSGDHVDSTPTDSSKRRLHRVVAIDAKMWNRVTRASQFRRENIDREINKAYRGFLDENPTADRNQRVAIATGNWGCGVFCGDRQLKFIIQLIAASQAERDMVYFTFNDMDLRQSLHRIYNYIIEHHMTVSDLYNLIIDYESHLEETSDTKKTMDVIDFIINSYAKNKLAVVVAPV